MTTFLFGNHEWHSCPVMLLMSRIQITDAQSPALCKGTRISSYGFLCVRTCFIWALSNNQKEEATGSPSHLYNPILLQSSSSLPPASKALLCPFTKAVCYQEGAIFHHSIRIRWEKKKKKASDERKLQLGEGQAPRQKNWGGFIYILKEKPAG